MVGDELPGRRQGAAVGAPLDQLYAGGALDVGDVLGHRRLADAELLRGRREGPAPRESRECPQPRFKIHNRGLYVEAVLCISVLTAHLRSLSSRGPRRSVRV